ncbi:mucin-binding protein, partial [Lactobacillus intestinalis]
TSDQTVTWTGNPATIDPANFIPEITTDNPNEKTIALPSTLQLTASDYEFLQNGKVISAPSEVGTYQVRLTEAGWQKVQKAIAGNTNYTWNYQGEGNYHIEKATANVTLDGSASTIYTGNSVVIPATAGVVNGINVKLSNGQTYVLKPEDLEFVNDQGNQIPAPTDAGTYKVRLTKAALDQIRNLESNHYNYTYNNDVVDFTIEKANADVTTSGSYDVVYNGQTPEINVDKITNAIATNNGVKLTSPTLTADDYEWVDETGKVITDPVNVGTYYLKLKDSSQSKIANNSNYIWNFKGLASVTISKANATIGFNGNQETSYTGSVITVDPDKFEVKLSNGQTYQLTDKDIQVIGNPINVGTYKVELSQAGIDAIKAADSNYNYSYDGSQGVLVIVPAKASATISGSQTTQDLELDPHNYSVVLTLNGQQQTITGLTASDFVFSKDGHPAQLTEAGTYDVELSGDAINKIRQENPNYNIDFSSTATFTLENSSQTINYVDADNKVISSTDIKGHLKGTKLSFTPEIPVGWVASDPSDVPTEITINNGTTIIKIKHGVTNVDHNNPVPDDAKTVTGEVIDGAHETDLNQTITRTINVTNPDGTKSTEVQTAKIYRNASYDNVTGEVTYGEWSTGSWKEFSPAEIKGYTASEKVVPAVEVKNGQQDETIDITYAANEQSGIISYQDEAGNEISTTSLSGKTGETVTVTPEVPAGWELVPGQDIPKTVTATAEGIPTVVIKIEHGITKVDHNNPVLDGEKTVTGKVINGAHANDLNQTITRTINVTNPDGIKSTEVQTAKIYRDASYDNVTGEVTYGEWSTANWSEFTPEKIDGYTPSEAVVPAVEVKDGQKNVTVDITYTANKQSTNIIYQDNTGQVIKTDKVNGETDQTVDVHSTVPAGWKLVNGYTIPSTITFGPDGHKDIVVQVEHATITITPDTPEDQIPNGKVPGDPDKTYPKMEKLVSEPTRIIVVTKPDGTKETVTQKVKFTRVATFDEVTGEVTYSDWKSTDSAVWEAYTPATIDGYTPNIAQVAQEAVGADTANVTVNISYTKNIVPPVEETQTIEYQDKDGKIIAREAITGEKGREMPFTPHIPENWQASGEVPKTITIGENSNKTIIRIEPKIETTELTKTVTRTIIEYLPNGDKKVVQKVTLTGTQSKNLVTGEVQTQWNSGKFDAYTPEKVAGYAASPNMVGEEVVNATTENSTIEITYVKDKVQASQVVQLVDSKGQVIASTTVVGKLGQEVTYNLPLPTNWEYTNGKPADQVKVENGITKIAIQHKTEEVTDTHTVTETIHFKYADQSQALPNTIQTITFIRNGVKDLVTGETIWGKWDKESSTFPEIVAPNISGYSPNPMTINAQTVGPNSQNLEFTVTYSPINKPNDDNNKPTPNPDNPVNPSKPDNNKPNKPDHNKPIEPNKPNKKPAKPVQPNKKPANKVPTKPVTPTIHKPSTKRSDNKPLYEEKDFPRGSHKLDNGTIVDSHGRVLYKNGKLTRLGRAMLKKGHEKVLPQTGQKDSENISWIGALLAGLGIFGLADRKKRKKKN